MKFRRPNKRLKAYRHMMFVLVEIYPKRGLDLPAEMLQLANDYLAGLRG